MNCINWRIFFSLDFNNKNNNKNTDVAVSAPWYPTDPTDILVMFCIWVLL